MNFFQLQDFLNKLHPEKNISFEFDEKCHRIYELVYTDGQPNPVHHIENDRVKVTIEGQKPTYMQIQPHRQCATWEHMKSLINLK